jgi:hypothetical protein
MKTKLSLLSVFHFNQLTNIGFKFKRFKGPEEHVPAMREIKSIVKNTEFKESDSSRTFAWSFAFAGWETDGVKTDNFIVFYISLYIFMYMMKAFH